jgi:hypothetical protein
MADHKLDIFETLKAINKHKADWLDNQPEEARKGFLPVIVMRWMSGVHSEYQVQALNQFVNPYIFSLYKYPDLLYKLMVAVAEGGYSRATWIKGPTTAGESAKVDVISKFYNMSSREARLYNKKFTSDELKEMAKTLDYQPDQLKKILKSL